MLCAQDLLLKLRAKIQTNNVEREANIIAIQECQNLIGYRINL